MQDVTIPALGMAMTEAVLIRWYKQPGDPVAAGDLLAEIETDKSVIELESPAAGTLGRHRAAEGDAVPVGEAVVRILALGETDTDAETPAQAGATPEAGSPGPVAAPAVGAAGPQPAELRYGRAPYELSPRQRRLARLAEQDAQSPAAAPGPDPERTRRAIAERVSQSWREIPHFTVQREVEAREAQAVLAALRARGAGTTYTDLLLRALALALRETVGASGDLGLAVATPAGVMMPVVTGVPGLDPAQLAAARNAAVQRGRDGRLNGADLASEPIASLSNLGSRGVDAFTGVIAVGQQLLLTVGSVRPRPVAVDDTLAVRPTLTATLNVDHREFDGDRAADILAAFNHEFGAFRAWAEGGHA